MSEIEDLLREALHEFADTIPETAQGRLTVPFPPSRRAPFRTGTGWLGPVGAAFAVAVLVALSSTVIALMPKGDADGEVADSAARPPVYVTVESGVPSELMVRESGSGIVKATYRSYSPQETFGLVGAAGDDRTFFVAAADSGAYCGHVVLYRMRVSGSGQITGFTRWTRQPAGDYAIGGRPSGALAVSPDGSEVAYAGMVCDSANTDSVRWSTSVEVMRDGRDPSYWTWHSSEQLPIRSLSWTSDGRLAVAGYFIQPTPPKVAFGVRFVSVPRAGDTQLTMGPQVLGTISDGRQVLDAVAAAHGRKLIAAVSSPGSSASPTPGRYPAVLPLRVSPMERVTILEYGLDGGAAERQLFTASLPVSTSKLVLRRAGSSDRLLVLAGERVYRLDGAEPQLADAGSGLVDAAW